MKVQVDRDACISAASCVAIAPGVFQLDDEGKAYVVKADGDTEQAIIEAAKSCPVQCITVTDDSGKKLFPEA